MTCPCRLSAFSLTQRIASLLVFGAEFGAVGFACGVLGSAVVKRAYPPQAANTASSYQQSVRTSRTMMHSVALGAVGKGRRLLSSSTLSEL